MYINNLVSERNMGDHEKKNESEMKLKELEERILKIEMAIMSFTHHLEQGSGHPDDGGWFD
jgi:hypothetical protein